MLVVMRCRALLPRSHADGASVGGVVQLAELTTAQIQQRVRIMEGNIRALTVESSRLDHEKKVAEQRLKENHEKIRLNRQLPYLVSNVVEVSCTVAPSPCGGVSTLRGCFSWCRSWMCQRRTRRRRTGRQWRTMATSRARQLS
jgi:hypothetical protein